MPTRYATLCYGMSTLWDACTLNTLLDHAAVPNPIRKAGNPRAKSI